MHVLNFGLHKTHRLCISNYTPNFSAILLAVTEIQKRTWHVQLIRLNTLNYPIDSLDTLNYPMNPLDTLNYSMNPLDTLNYPKRYPKRLDNWSLTTLKMTAKSVQPFSRYATLGHICTKTCLHVHTNAPYL